MPSPLTTSPSSKFPNHLDGSLKRRLSDDNIHASQRDLRNPLPGDCTVKMI